MAEINAALVAKLREMTGAGLMDCKKALVESDADLEKAVEFLRKKGIASAEKKAGRAANEGVIVQHIQPGAKVGVLVEIDCETDFVAKNESFRIFCDDVARKLATDSNANIEADRVSAVAKIGENIVIARNQRIEAGANGLVAAYIHTGAKVGVLVEVGAGKAETTTKDEFKQLVRDITLQIAAGHPHVVSREQVPQEVIAKEREIAAQSDRLKGKPPQAMEKILAGVLEKFFQTYCLVEQGFVKRNSEVTVREHMAQISKQIGDDVFVRRFVRFQVGESVA